MDKPWYRRIFSHSQVSAEPDLDEPVLEPVTETVQVRAERGDADAQFRLGLLYASGECDAQDYSQAAEWYLKAAGQSHSMAQFNLGMMYSKGQGVPQSDDNASAWILKAANLGDAGAQFLLGIKHLRNSFGGIPGDAIESKIEAYKWLQLSTEQGYGGSQNALHSLIFGMTREAVAAGNLRAASFSPERLPERTEEKTPALAPDK